MGKLAYVQGGDIWVKALPEGEPLRLTSDGSNSEPRWSLSGQWLTFRKGDDQVWVMRADGTEARLLNEGTTCGEPGTGVLDAAWSRDGEWCVYDRVDVLKEGENGQPPERHASLWRIRADGSGAS